MPSFTAPIRTFAAVAILAVGANVGIASASAKTAKHETSKTHQVRKARTSHRDVKKSNKKHEAKSKKLAAQDKKHAKRPVKSTAPTATTATVSPTSTTPEPAGIKGNWNLVLNSNFDSSSLDTNVWHAAWWGTGSGVSDPVNVNEDDCYNSNNVVMSGTALDLNVTHQSSTCNGSTYPWTGAIVDTDPSDGRASGGFQYTYGVLEARVYIPATASGDVIANWPAVWANAQRNSVATNGEDDLFEGLNGQACYHYHDQIGAPGECDTKLTPGWHTFSSNWQPGSVTYYYDGTEVGKISSGITSTPMYIILDNTVPKAFPGQSQPSTMQIQYVRVWQS